MNIPPVKVYFSKEEIERLKVDLEIILKSGMLTLHNYTRKFESKFKDLVGTEYAIATNSGTGALEIVLKSLLRTKSDVIVPTNTFTATLASIVLSGNNPILSDINEESLCMDLNNIQNCLTPKTRAVIVVHLGGLICPDIKLIKKLCEAYKLFLIEDAAHAHGCTIDGEYAGSLGDAGCFSFYPTKVITTGEGGMITTNNVILDKTARVLRDQGKINFNTNRIIKLGNNWRLPEINAAIGLSQLELLEKKIEERNKIAEKYNKGLEKIDFIIPRRIPHNIKSNYYKYVTFLDSDINRANFKSFLKKRGVNCSGEVYFPPLHSQPIYNRNLKLDSANYPVANEMCNRMVCLPIYPNMKDEEVKYVIDMIKEWEQ